MPNHPRFNLYPQHETYRRMRVDFRPFVMFCNEPDFRSEYVNTDAMGLREQYTARGAYMDVAHLRDSFESCRVIAGGSTVFGVDASSDRQTISHHLNQLTDPEGTCPFVSLGIRGATGQQELIGFLIYSRFLPPIKEVVLLSGVNDAAIIGMEDMVFYEHFGGVFSEQYHFQTFADQYKAFAATPSRLARSRLHARVDRLLERLPALGRWLDGWCHVPPERVPQRPQWDETQRREHVLAVQHHNLGMWAALSRGSGFGLTFVLQPAINWTRKSLTPDERDCFEMDWAAIPSLPRYATGDFFAGYRRTVAEVCASHGIRFLDANDWFNRSELEGTTCFTDVCHLTDAGSQALASALASALQGEAGS